MSYDKPEMNTIWQEKVNRIFETKPKGEEELFLDIVAMFIYSTENDNISVLYKELGLEKFARILGLIGGQTIEMPSQERLRDGLMAALCFYYKEIKKYPWTEIHKILPFNDINSIKYGRAISRLEKEIVEKIKNNFEEIEENDGGIDELRKYL